MAGKSRLWWHVSLGGAWWWWHCPRAGAGLAHWQLWGDQMVPRIIRRHVGLAALQAGRRVKSSMPFYQLVDTGRVIIPLHFASRWRLIFFYSLFSTHLQCDWLLTPFLIHVWRSETLAHTRLHNFHPVWSRYSHTYSLKEWVRCLSCIANWCFIYHQWEPCLHFPPIVLYKRTERTNVLKLVLSCIIKHTNTFYMYLYADDFLVSVYIRLQYPPISGSESLSALSLVITLHYFYFAWS